ncbi:S49 family peptidase [Sphingomonas panaciterrae]|uniref:S49 family peptidase n=1 Tax=Sphingomonas panaciterrae TaxID=1462999 RepID=UPI002FF16134
MSRLARLASSQLFNVPLMIDPAKAEVIVAALQERLGVVSFERIDGVTLNALDLQASAGDATFRGRARDKLYPIESNVAVIEVDGTLVHKYGYVDPMSGLTGYDGIAQKLRSAMADREVKAIWFDYDSPGGATAGCFTLAEEIARCTKSEGGKPIWAFVNETACSAAYALASVCDKIYAPADAIAGSIGVYCMHVDLTEGLSKEGIKVEMIRAGEQKARGGPYETLDDRTRAKLQAWVDETRQRFATLVAAGRRMSKAAVLATEADWFPAAEALKLGLIDGVMSEPEAWAKLQRSIARAN